MSDARVVTWIEDGVAHVRLNRPDKRNGLDLPMFRAIVDAGRALIDDVSVRAVVLGGEGPAFCAGLDFKAFMASPNAKELMLARPEERPANLAQEVGWVWQEVPVPVIAAIHGPCFGGGLQIALGADIRLAGPDAKLSVMEIEYGLIPDMSATKTLLTLVQPDIAKELTFTGRIVDAQEALALGLVTRVVPDAIADATSLAKLIASKSPHALRAAKKLYSEAPPLSTRDAFELETNLQMKLLGSRNQMEAAMARMQKRPPVFRDPE